MDGNDFQALITRIENATGPDRAIGHAVTKVLVRHVFLNCKPVGILDDDDVQTLMLCRKDSGQDMTITDSLDLVQEMIAFALPGFYQSSGLCALSGHASIGPDYNGPEGDRLRAEWPEDRFHEGFHADLKPGDGRHRQCLALMHCAMQALQARAAAPIFP